MNVMGAVGHMVLGSCSITVWTLLLKSWYMLWYMLSCLYYPLAAKAMPNAGN